MELKQLLKDYAELKHSESEIAGQIEALKPEVIKAMEAAGLDKQPTSLGNFNLIPRKTWTYSPSVTSATDALKELKKTEEQTGVATATESKQLRFDPIKENEDAN